MERGRLEKLVSVSTVVRSLLEGAGLEEGGRSFRNRWNGPRSRGGAIARVSKSHRGDFRSWESARIEGRKTLVTTERGKKRSRGES